MQGAPGTAPAPENRFGVCCWQPGAEAVRPIVPPAPGEQLSRADALLLAAYLVKAADPQLDDFSALPGQVLAT